MTKQTFGVYLLLMMWAGGLSADGLFPGRSQYKSVEVIELKALHDQLSSIAVVDVRSEYEFETLRIAGAINIPVADPDFAKRVRNIRGVTGKRIVFYCNGHTCMKSYQAARQAKLAKIPDVAAFDAGVFDWAKAFPNETLLLGKTLVTADRLLSKEKLATHELDPKQFADYADRGGNSIVILDVRDRFQRAAVGLFPFKETWIPLDQPNRVADVIDRAARSGQTLLVYDEVGKQVKWLQYRLEEAGLKKYFFMKGGAKAYIDGI